MKAFIAGIVITMLLASCRQNSRPIVETGFIDSLLAASDSSLVQKALQTDLLFWKQRIDPSKPGLVNELRYASCLVQRFQQRGDIRDILEADSILNKTDRLYRSKESSVGLALVRINILQHRFREADSIVQELSKRDLKPYDAASIRFDVAFERGQYLLAENELKKIADPGDYGYLFRKAKMAHYQGEPDTAIAAMEMAAKVAGTNTSLQQAAWSNAADLSLHNGDPRLAYTLYRRSLQGNGQDLHSLAGIGWIALTHDHNDSLAQRIFGFIQAHTQSPDILLKLAQVAEMQGNREAQLQYLHAFERAASEPAYGNMYNKYLLELYTGPLADPAKSEAISARELNNRSTAQTWAWYVYALFLNQQRDKANLLFQEHVSGKPLEGLELYWMGKYMEGVGKGYNAKRFYEAAYKNRYDLDLAVQDSLEQKLQ